MGRDGAELKGLIEYAIKHNGPIAGRYPKLNTVDMEKVLINDEKWQVLKEGSKGIVISYGPDLDRILKIISDNNLDLSVINARFIRPLDEAMLDKIAQSNLPLFVYEQVVESSCLAMMMNFYFMKKGYNIPKFKKMSFETNTIVTHGNITDVLDYYKLGDKDILEALNSLCKD
jgi:1-deoxy-D-xylulose-5-phosphate synthase